MKTNKMIRTLGIAVILLCGMLLSVSTVYANTDGTELQVEQPSTLELQLGPGWAGVEFQLKTDAGLYPGTITVGADGVLRTELGGSSSYILSCLNAGTPAPSPEDALAPIDSEAAAPDMATDDQPAPETAPAEENEAPATQEANDEEATVGGIPVKHMILFAGGLLLAIGCLVGITVAKKRRASGSSNKAYDDDEDDW